jgi:HK97 family phage prohead protease
MPPMPVSLSPAPKFPLGLEKKFAGLTIGNVSADGSFSGYASLFGEVDLGKDAIKAGAFEKTLNQRGAAGIRMLWQHDPNQPIGVWTKVREDKRGLYVEGKLTTGVAKAQEVLELMRSGAIDGLSIGFKTVRARADAAGVRHIHEADLWEISVVTFPMLPSARVGQVKSQPANRPKPDYKHQPRILWNIKANELLLAVLKRASPSDYNRRWIESLEAENAELKRRSTNYELFRFWLSHKFDPNQPRVSAGNSDGGRWTDGGGTSGQGIARTRPITSRGGQHRR